MTNKQWLKIDGFEQKSPSAHARTNVEREHQAHCAHPAVGITSTEPGGLARPRKTICKLKRLTDLERTTDILCQWYALIAALSRIALAAAIVRIILIGGDVPVCKTCMNCGHRTHRDHRCPDHHCTHCQKQGHRKRFGPDVQCPHCDLFGHVNKVDCKYKHCTNVDVGWLNILISVSASHTITELLQAIECTVDPNTLRSGGKFRKFADCQWEHVKQTCDSISAQQLLELKRVTSDFQKDRMREHKSIESKLNKRTEAPVNFAFTEDYDHISVAKCRYCKAWLFWPETTQKEWCCGQGKYIELINPWSQPTDAFRSLCIDDTNEANRFVCIHVP